jgi:hypothetical protein
MIHSSIPPSRGRQRRKKRPEDVMSFEIESINTAEIDAARRAGVIGALPGPLVMTQRCAAELRGYLHDAKLGHYRIFHSPSHELYDIERTLEKLGEVAAWEDIPPLVHGGEPIHAITHD